MYPISAITPPPTHPNHLNGLRPTPALKTLTPICFSGRADRTDTDKAPFNRYIQKLRQLWKNLTEKVIKLLRWATYKLGLKEQHKQLHLKLFPGYQATLKNAQKNATISLPEGGIQLLKPIYDPAEKKMVYPKGMLFLDGIPYNQPDDEIRQLSGMHIWLNSNAFHPDGSGKEENYTHKANDLTVCHYLDQLVKRIQPEEALRLMNQEKDYWTHKGFYEAPHSSARLTYFFSLCSKVAEKPGLLKISPNWFIGENKPGDYNVPGLFGYKDYWGSIKAHSADNEYLESIGYKPMSQAFQAFNLPRTVHVIDKLVEEGKIPPKREARKPHE